LLDTLATTSSRAPHALRTVLRGILLSPSHRERLAADVGSRDSVCRVTLRGHLETVGRYSTYAAHSADVLSHLG
jgi:hypothetical protein